MVKWPLENRSAGSRVVVKENRRSVQWCTDRTRSSRKALMGEEGRVTGRAWAAGPRGKCRRFDMRWRHKPTVMRGPAIRANPQIVEQTRAPGTVATPCP